MDFSILIATYDRAESLDQLLRSVAEHFVKSSIAFEIIVANNARDETSARRIDAMIGKFIDAMPSRFRQIREASAGKCRLGPGRSGISEDVEFAQRVLRSGMRIGYEPGAGVFHEVDWRRLSEEFIRERHEQQGRSRLIYKKTVHGVD